MARSVATISNSDYGVGRWGSDTCLPAFEIGRFQRPQLYFLPTYSNVPRTHQTKALCESRTMENGASSEGKDPSAFLGEIIGAPVTVKLNSGVVYKGS